MGEAEVDFPFRVSPSEQAIIESDPNPPCSIVLVGRSGTGKTTCAVFRMWARWLTFRHHSTEPFNQVASRCLPLPPTILLHHMFAKAQCRFGHALALLCAIQDSVYRLPCLMLWLTVWAEQLSSLHMDAQQQTQQYIELWRPDLSSTMLHHVQICGLKV